MSAAAKPSTPPPSPVSAVRQRLQAQLYELRFHALIAVVSSAALFSLLRAGPGVAAVVSFFKPLLLSTAVFLAAVVFLRVVSPSAGDVDGDKAGADLIDYVAGAAEAAAEGGGGGEEREERGEEEHSKSQ